MRGAVHDGHRFGDHLWRAGCDPAGREGRHEPAAERLYFGWLAGGLLLFGLFRLPRSGLTHLVCMVVPPATLLAVPNITRGRGGVTADFTLADWDRALRHGVRPDGSGLVLMPSEDYAALTDHDDDLTCAKR